VRVAARWGLMVLKRIFAIFLPRFKILENRFVGVARFSAAPINQFVGAAIVPTAPTVHFFAKKNQIYNSNSNRTYIYIIQI